MQRFLMQTIQRVVLLAVTLATGLFALGLQPASALFGQTHPGISQPRVSSLSPAPFSSHLALSTQGDLQTKSESGFGAGDSINSLQAQHSEKQAGVCNPLDMTCLAQAALAAILAPVTQTLTMFCDTVLKNVAAAFSTPSSVSQALSLSNGQKQGQKTGPTGSLSFNFLTQTPLCFSTLYSACAPSALDGAIAPFVGWTQAVAASALALLLVIGGLGISLGQQAGWQVQNVSQLIPRLILTALATWMAPAVVQVGIDLNNLLSQGALQVAQIGTLATQIGNLANPANPTANLLVLLFLLAATVMAILLIGQMGLRLAFVALLGGLAPLGLFCFGLPLSSGWGRLWMQQFSLAVFVQFVQVAALALGGALLVALSAPTASLFAGVPDATPIVESILLIMLFYLAVRIPAMISAYAARHITNEIGQATMQTIEGAGQMLALLVA